MAARHKTLVRLFWPAALAALGLAVAPRAHASYREALAAEAETAYNYPTKRYVASDSGALLAVARHDLYFRLPNQDPTSKAPYQYGFFDCEWSEQQILAYATAGGYSTASSDLAARGLNWGGDPLPFLSLLLLRSGCVDALQVLLAYEDLEANAEPIRSAQRGDVAFYDDRQPRVDGDGDAVYDSQGRPVIDVEEHAAVVLEVQQTGLVLIDSNWVADQTIGEHSMTWQDLEHTYKFQAADVERLVGYLHNSIRPPGYCQSDLSEGAALADLGSPASEANFDLENWGPINNDGKYTSPSGDKTKRYMQLRQESSLTFSGLLLGVDYELSAEVENGACDDSFSILANGTEVYRYRAAPSSKTTIIPHICTVPSALLPAGTLKVTFQNEATDSCGLAAVYNVKLKPVQ